MLKTRVYIFIPSTNHQIDSYAQDSRIYYTANDTGAAEGMLYKNTGFGRVLMSSYLCMLHFLPLGPS